ncbi:MAG: hypothetical protein EBS86_08020 [Crocinitomicaceae bacterium]|nr:hypothetical protein [Crocinitomicaceae bacterium]
MFKTLDLTQSSFVIFESQNKNMAISSKELEFNFNDDQMRLKISALEQQLSKIYEGGGKKRVEKLHASGKLTARERIDLLLDPNTERVEIGALAGYVCGQACFLSIAIQF